MENNTKTDVRKFSNSGILQIFGYSNEYKNKLNSVNNLSEMMDYLEANYLMTETQIKFIYDELKSKF